MRFWITDVPYPLELAAQTDGPPASCHSRTSLLLASQWECLRQRTDIRPCPLEKALYFEALVASSCRTIDTGCVASAVSTMSEPSISVLPPCIQGASSPRTSSARLTPCQRLRLKRACVFAKECRRPSSCFRK